MRIVTCLKRAIAAVILVIAVCLSVGSLGYAQKLDEGVAAHKKKDYVTALHELRALAKRGNANAQYILGTMYHNAQGVTRNYNEAAKWFRRAAEQGHMSAQGSLGVMYRNGRGVTQSYTEAVKWYRKAAEQGHTYSQVNLGGMYQDGLGVPQDYGYAHMWYNISASRGNGLAAFARKLLEKQMTAAQIAEAQRLARECVRKKFKGCE